MTADLCKALGEATDALPAAVDAYERAPTSHTRDVMDAALHEYVQRLCPVIGDVEAFRYEARSATYQNATDRVEQLNARLSTLPSMDEADRTLRRRLLEEREVAGKAFERARAALEAALERALAHLAAFKYEASLRTYQDTIDRV